MALATGQHHTFVRVHLAKTQRLLCVITDYIVTENELLFLWFQVLDIKHRYEQKHFDE